MKDNIVNIYLNYLSKVNYDKNYVPNIEENTAIYNVTHDVIYSDLINQLNQVNDFESKKNILTMYIAKEEAKNIKNGKDAISKIFGVNIEDIDSVRLENGKDVYAFYDKQLGRKRLIESLNEDSLIERLKEIQNNNEKYQTDDYKKNSEEILKNQAMNNNNRHEFKMVDVNDYITHPENYGVLDEDSQTILNRINNAKDDLRIKYINIENKVLLTEDNKVLEISKTNDGSFVFNEPKKWKNNVDEVDNKEKVNEEEKEISNSEDVDVSIESNEFEDEPEFISAEEIEEEIRIQKVILKGNTNEIMDKIKYYYNNPIEIDAIEDESEKVFYNRMVNEVYAVRKAQYEKKKAQTMAMTYRNPDLNNNGFVNLIFISIILLFLAFVLFIGL